MGYRSELYSLAGEISASAGLEPSFFSDAKILLADANLLNAAVGRDVRGKGTNHGTATAILSQILSITLPFQKLVEFITVGELVRGSTTRMLPPAGCSERTVRRALHVLEQEGYLVRVVSDLGRTVFYGLNLPVLIERLAEALRDVPMPKEGTTAHDQRLRLERVHRICSQLHRWYATLKQLTEKALEALRESLKTLRRAAGGAMAGLQESVKQAKERSAAARADRRSRKANAASFFHEKRGKLKGSGRDALEFWNAQAEARSDQYPGFSAKSTKKMQGMMSNFLMELKDDDSPEEATRKIRNYFEDVIENWKAIGGTSIYEQKYGTHKRVPKNPSFEFFYTFRAELKAKLAERKIRLEEGKTKKREKIKKPRMVDL